MLALGYRYLWIDRYCIEQTDCPARHLQIQQMGNTYSSASVTIIAAAGSNPHHGLPGVSQTPRITQPSEMILGSLVIGFPDAPRASIQNSVWNTRAWTYQEALLSRRRLIFSEQQVYFECQKSCREECYVDNRVDLFAMGDPIFHEQRFGLRPEEIFRYISIYSKKSLTFDTDYLNAFLGILRALGKQQHPVEHISGVPIFPPVIYNFRNGTLKKANRSCSERFMVGMTWAVSSGRRRSAMFPSWSWAGWAGEVGWTRHHYNEENVLYSPGPYCRLLNLNSSCQVWTEETNGELVPLEHSQNDQRRFEIFKIIHVESTTFPLTLAHDHMRRNIYRPDSADEFHPRYLPRGDCITWNIEGGMTVYCPVVLFEEPLKDPVKEIIMQQRELKALLIGTWAGHQHNETADHWEAKLLRRLEDGYEVVGHISFSQFDLHFELDQDTRLALENVTRESLMPKCTRERVRLL